MPDRRFNRNTIGQYYGSTGVLSILNTAHTSLQGFAWLLNPVGSIVTLFVRRFEFKYMASALAAINTRLTIERITFTGGPATDLVTPIQRNSAEPAPVARWTSGTTGITPTTVSANAILYSSWVPSIFTAVGTLESDEDEWVMRDEDSYIRLLAGEGIVMRQPDNGIASDPRKAVFMVEWEEFNF